MTVRNHGAVKSERALRAKHAGQYTPFKNLFTSIALPLNASQRRTSPNTNMLNTKYGVEPVESICGKTSFVCLLVECPFLFS